jgi:hypothetical protein
MACTAGIEYPTLIRRIASCALDQSLPALRPDQWALAQQLSGVR